MIVDLQLSDKQELTITIEIVTSMIKEWKKIDTLKELTKRDRDVLDSLVEGLKSTHEDM